MYKLLLLVATILVSPSVYSAGEFKPYQITPGASYYSNEYSVDNGISQLGEEKNLEEVYQNYNYYEAIFDSQERIVEFKAYKKGAIEFVESYYYDEDGQPLKKATRNPDGSTSVVTF